MIDLAHVPPELFAPILAGNLRRVAPARKLMAHFLEAAGLRLGADACWLTRAGQGERLLPGGRLACGDPLLCDEALTTAFLRREHPAIPGGVVLASLVVHGRQVAVAGAARRGGFEPAARRVLERLCDVLAEELARREEERLARVLDRIRGKIVSELRPRDLAYQILDGLHQLVDYDHSAAVLAYDRAAGVFRVEAEKIVWTKAKSPFVGREIRVPPEQIGRICRTIEIHTVVSLPGGQEGAGDSAADLPSLASPAYPPAAAVEPVEVAAAAAAADAAPAPAPPSSGGLAGLLDYQREAGMPPVASLLAAPLFYGDEFLGLLKVAAWRRPPFTRRDVEVVERFLPAAAVSMRNARVNRSLEMQAVEAEVKASLVTLSHAVAHDVNNAVGSILPLAQQMRFDLRHAPLDRETLDRDLGVIIDNARLCQRIFSNMLRVAGSGRASEGPVDAAQVVAETLPFLLAVAGRRGIEIALDLAPDLPPVRFRRQDLQHVVLNLVRNSLDALVHGGQGGQGGQAGQTGQGRQGGPGGPGGPGSPGGQVEIGVRLADPGSVELFVADDGPGIPLELLSKVQEPFFSTRPGGTGLGLTICRALAWQNGASLRIESPVAAPAEVVLSAAGPAPPRDPTAVASAPFGDRRSGPGDTGDTGGHGAFAGHDDTGFAGTRGTRVTLRLEAEPPVHPREAW